MKATIMQWTDVKPGVTVVMQGTLMKFLREEEDKIVDEVRVVILEFDGHEMPTGVFDDWYVAVVDQEDAD